MRIVILTLVTAFLVSGCVPNQETRQIVVDGEAKIEVVPETFSLAGNIRSRGETRDVALEEISSTLTKIRETVPALEGLAKLKIEASDASLRPIQDDECIEAKGYRGSEMCPVLGYFGEIDLKVSGSPAKYSGQVLSLVSEMGAEQVSLNSYSVNDPDAAQSRAMAAAMENARGKANRLAAAAGATVVGPLKVQFGEGFGDDYGEANLMVAYAAPDNRYAGGVVAVPEVDLDLDPQPISVSATVVASFEIE